MWNNVIVALSGFVLGWAVWALAYPNRRRERLSEDLTRIRDDLAVELGERDVAAGDDDARLDVFSLLDFLIRNVSHFSVFSLTGLFQGARRFKREFGEESHDRALRSVVELIPEYRAAEAACPVAIAANRKAIALVFSHVMTSFSTWLVIAVMLIWVGPKILGNRAARLFDLFLGRGQLAREAHV